ncbi:hypothetical protein CEXT_267651 [Caerostris extrusa]|uniref:Uncharacterized protein n=1 Tax=Caerostris extrusa TaxID=172846 RepID=A0AAV4UM22_CAEEX|nr:hypothetical protein CEXT_267651 [Caerostris extrusa]
MLQNHTHQSPKLLVAGLSPPFQTHAFPTEGCLYGVLSIKCSISNLFHVPNKEGKKGSANTKRLFGQISLAVRGPNIVLGTKKEEDIGKNKRDGKKRKVFINGTFRSRCPRTSVLSK